MVHDLYLHLVKIRCSSSKTNESRGSLWSLGWGWLGGERGEQSGRHVPGALRGEAGIPAEAPRGAYSGYWV